MPSLKKIISTSYTAEHLFALVKNIEEYPMFLPWCSAARILNHAENVIIAELVIKYKLFRSKYTSKVTLIPNQEIIVTLVDGPFKFLHNSWKFVPETNGFTTIEFTLDFKLKSNFLEGLISNEFDNYATKLMEAFLKRAEEKALC